MQLDRRQLLGAAIAQSIGAAQQKDVRQSVERAHEELWRRFIDKRYHTFYDYAGLQGEIFMPTAQECAKDMPNALAWWSPIENGAFFGGIYLDGLINRWRVLRTDAAAADVKKIVEGLLRLSSVGRTPGFICRGVIDDGKTHHVAGSDDQTFPWLYGLWRYVRSEIPGESERRAITASILKVAKVLEAAGWQMPTDRPGFGSRGSWAGPPYNHVVRVLFAHRALFDLTGDRHWLTAYRQRLEQKPEGSPASRREICAAGALYDPPGAPRTNELEFWTSASTQSGLRALHDLETDSELRSAYRQGLDNTAKRALPHVELFRKFDRADSSVFQVNWRFLNDYWIPQENIAESVVLARVQVREWHRRSPRRVYEARWMREPLFAAWIVQLAGNPGINASLQRLIDGAQTHFDWAGLYTSLFFIVENVHYEYARPGS